ncbi:MAG: translation initiation factor IF-2 N-terminal domain-containing protein, partial [Actinomycetota bacterium]|nr:translation initiation factor IF-2 N-terminal domain-containing protein [Actinomycetota bacterium]
MPKKIRVYELAHELGLTNKEALDLCLSLGMGVKSHSSSIEDAQADRARRKADREGLRRPVQPEEPASKPARKASGTTKKAAARATSGEDRPSPAEEPSSAAPVAPAAGEPAPGGPTTPRRSGGSRLVTSRPASEVTAEAARPAATAMPRPAPVAPAAPSAPAAQAAPVAPAAPAVPSAPAAPVA